VILAALLTAAAVRGAAGARAELVGADLNILLGEKFLSYTDWGPNDRQGELGVLTNWQRRGWPVAIAADFLAASREAAIGETDYTNQHARTFEFDLGARKIWKPTGSLRVFAGGGPTLAYSYLNNLSGNGKTSSSDSGEGYWVDCGAFWAFDEVFNVGIDGRYSNATVRIYGLDRNAGGLHVGLLAGYHFGG
jgi:hypothetical protein